MKYITPLFFAVILMMISCSNSNTNNNATDQSQPDIEATTSSDKGKKAPKTEEAVLARVNAIYTDVFGEYNEADLQESIPQSSPDEKYCSSDWNTILGKVADFDSVNNPDDIGFFDADYWVMGQDFHELSISDVQLKDKSADGNKATVEFKLHNSGEVTTVDVDMVYEKDNWFIDNFIDVDNDINWKQEMLDYLKENNVK